MDPLKSASLLLSSLNGEVCRGQTDRQDRQTESRRLCSADIPVKGAQLLIDHVTKEWSRLGRRVNCRGQ